ncbi:MAG TPA: serine/threonine-protein kinase, partial [Candidatus Acidoferrales bacterium]|nr:serine/threonine-protein kinase [Candidatus Acidoferrales bacterium]
MTARRSTFRKLGKYEIIRELGRGAMGVVFKARDPLIGRLVALKTITAGPAGDPDLLQRFYREAQAAGSLQHPNVITIYEMGEEGGVPFIAMEYIEGKSLEQIIASRPPLALAQRVAYIVQTCRALDYAHRRGIVHRDIKPANIMVTMEGQVKVVDFGIARFVDTSKTQTGTLLGTLAYMSPEQLRGGRADERSDIWSVGVMFYELLSYQKPFTGQNHAALLLSIINDEPRPIGECVPECPAELRVLLHKALHKDKDERFQTMAELLSELEPMWKRMQHEVVEQLVSQSQECIGKGDLPEARQLLRQAVSIDASRSEARMLLEEVKEALRGTLLPGALQEHLTKARSLLDEGLLEEARTQARAALDLDPDCEPARQFLETLSEAERTEAQQTEAGSDPGRSGRDAEHVYAFEIAANRSVSSEPGDAIAEGPTHSQVAAPAGQTTRILDSRNPLPKRGAGTHAVETPRRPVGQQVDGAPHTLPTVSPEHSPTGRGESPFRKRAVAYGLAAMVLSLGIGLSIYWKLGSRQSPMQPGQPAQPASLPVPPASKAVAMPSAEEQQRELIARAHEAADRSDYRDAQARLDEAEKLQGPLQPLVQDLRKKFSLEEQNSDVRRVAQKERELWNEGTSQFAQNHFDRAENAFRQILELPEGGRRKIEARRYINEVIPARKIATRPAAPAQQSPVAQGRSQQIEQNEAAAAAERAKLDRLEVQFQQAQQRGGDVAREQLRDLQGQYRAIADAGGPLASTARNHAENLIPAAIGEIDSKQAKGNAETAELTRFNEAVEHFNQAVAAKDGNA